MKEQKQQMEEKKEQKNPREQQSERKKRIALIIALAAVICIILLIAMVSCQPQQKNEAETLESGMILPESSQEGLESDVASSDIQPSNSPEEENKPVTEEPEGAISSGKPSKTETSDKKNEQKPANTPKPSTEKTNKPSPTPQPSKPAHQHTWVDLTENRKVLVQEAWDEDVYEEKCYSICNQCGANITNKIDAHWDVHPDGFGYHSEYVDVKTGTIHHDAEYKTETVVTGQKCSGCGATK